VTFRDGQTVVPERVTLTLNDVTFAYDKQAQNALEGINLS
jgi:ATP-binding cassette subfamily C protein CydC